MSSTPNTDQTLTAPAGLNLLGDENAATGGCCGSDGCCSTGI